MQLNSVQSNNTNSVSFGVYFRHEKWYNPRKGRAHYEAIQAARAAKKHAEAQRTFRIQHEIAARTKAAPEQPVKTDEFDTPIIRKIKEICRFDTQNISREKGV